MANRTGVNRFTRPIPGYTCGHTRGGLAVCLHTRDVHKFDEIDGSSWCDECWADEDAGLNQIAYHYFEEGAYANV